MWFFTMSKIFETPYLYKEKSHPLQKSNFTALLTVSNKLVVATSKQYSCEPAQNRSYKHQFKTKQSANRFFAIDFSNKELILWIHRPLNTIVLYIVEYSMLVPFVVACIVGPALGVKDPHFHYIDFKIDLRIDVKIKVKEDVLRLVFDWFSLGSHNAHVSIGPYRRSWSCEVLFEF